jgi:hypothetical protein
MVGIRTTDRDNTTEVPRRSRRMDQTPQSNHDPLAQRQQPKTLARTRKNRRSTRRHPEKGNPPPIPRLGNQRTPRTRPHHRNRPPTLLVARHERMDCTIRKRVCQMPTKQEYHKTSKGPPLPHSHTDQRTPIPDHSDGPDHPTPDQQRIRRHPHDSRPRMHESGRIPPLQDNNHRARSGQTILRQRLPMVRPAR